MGASYVYVGALQVASRVVLRAVAHQLDFLGRGQELPQGFGRLLVPFLACGVEQIFELRWHERANVAEHASWGVGEPQELLLAAFVHLYGEEGLVAQRWERLRKLDVV
eukprot:2814001-Alexandrium_andersonii.AAC.1